MSASFFLQGQVDDTVLFFNGVYKTGTYSFIRSLGLLAQRNGGDFYHYPCCSCQDFRRNLDEEGQKKVRIKG